MKRSCWAAGDRLVLGRELRDRSPCFLFCGDGLVCGELGAHVLQHPVEDGPRGRIRIIRRVWGGVVVVGAVGGDVDEVCVPAAGHRDVQVLLVVEESARTWEVSVVMPWALCAVTAYPRST